ncbi:hypothetical protein HYV86_02545 [Candidatus Woesearchaeota archaeon]|nr:hypothetical protein [Candidatus Woesearchaeota archaeon]
MEYIRLSQALTLARGATQWSFREYDAGTARRFEFSAPAGVITAKKALDYRVAVYKDRQVGKNLTYGMDIFSPSGISLVSMDCKNLNPMSPARDLYDQLEREQILLHVGVLEQFLSDVNQPKRD